MAKDNTFSFSISERGETSGEMFNWNFTAKRMLSIRDRMSRDSIRRQLIGDSPQNAEQNTLLRAEMLATLQVALVETPKAWKTASNGLDLFDDNVLVALYEKVVTEHNKAQDEAAAMAEEVTKKLRRVARDKKSEGESEQEEPTKE